MGYVKDNLLFIIAELSAKVLFTIMAFLLFQGNEASYPLEMCSHCKFKFFAAFFPLNFISK